MKKARTIVLSTRHCALLLSFVILLTASQSQSAGFGIFTQGADALGRANATVAQSDGASAAYFNPALLPSLSGTRLEIGTTAVVPVRKFKSDLDGSIERNEDTVYFPSTFYLTHQFNDRWSAGLAVFNPFGLGTIWDSGWEGNVLATKSRITTFNINPVVAFQVTPRLALGAGLDIVLLDAKLKSRVGSEDFPILSAIDQSFTGDGEGLGYNVGLHLQLTDALSFGAAYRSEIRIDIDGRASFRVPDFLQEDFGFLFGNTRGKTSLTLPAQLTAALAYQLSPEWVVEAGIRWEEWSSFRRLKIDLAQPVAGSDTTLAPRNWKNTWAFNVGTKYHLNERLALMAGYLYGENPVPDSTFEPAIPDSDTHLFTVGGALSFDRFSLDLAYGFQLQENRRKTTNEYGDIANGRYKNQIHLVAASLGYAF